MKKFLVLGVCIAGLLVSCNQKKTPTEEHGVENSEMDHHNAENSLDLTGTYKGLLPCADCEGIETVIVLNNDKTYEITSLYLGTKGNGEEFVEQGSWDIKGNIIKLHDHTQDELVKQLKVGENYVKYLDLEGEEIKGTLAEFYILKKQ